LPDHEWRFETGKIGWGNNELQNYVAGLGADVAARLEEGILKITVKERGDEVISVRINTRRSWLYGYFEARLKLPQGKGTWPAFWMLLEDFALFPDDGESDIMEAAGYDPGWARVGIHSRTYTNGQKRSKKDTHSAK
jgi:beta-glucanase (GH16 family)